MSKPKSTGAAQKKKRLTQLRDAQRRRRERLKKNSKHFVQIILSKEVLQRLQDVIEGTGETMQQAIGRLVESSLPPWNAELGSLTPAAETDDTLSSAGSSLSDAEEVERANDSRLGDGAVYLPDGSRLLANPVARVEWEIRVQNDSAPGETEESDRRRGSGGQLDLFG